MKKNILIDKLGRPIHDLRISVIDRCNFRCNYCMPPDETKEHHFLKKQEWLSFEEIERLVRLFVSLGARKIRLTGGEPLLRPNLIELIQSLQKIKDIEEIALTTNGSLLCEYAKQLKDAGLSRVTISLDTINSRLFRLMSGDRGDLEKVLEGIRVAEEAGFSQMKINVVVQKGINDFSIMEMIESFRGTGHILRFIEFMDVGNCNHWESKFVVPSKEIVDLIGGVYPLEPVESNYFGEVAERYRYKDGGGEIGFVSSVSQPFCQTCTRARLSADGQLLTCLFAQGGTDLKSPLREEASDEELISIIRSVWQQRDDRYSEIRPQQSSRNGSPKKVEMFQIGG